MRLRSTNEAHFAQGRHGLRPYDTKGRAAFRRFKDYIYRRAMKRDWRQYRHRRLEEIAIDRLEAKKIPFIRDNALAPEPSVDASLHFRTSGSIAAVPQ